MSANVILKVWCTQCDDDKSVSESGCLGVLERTVRGSLRWTVEDRRRRRQQFDGRRFAHGIYLKHWLRSAIDVPEYLPASCERHGRGFVRTADVIEHRANVSIEMIPATP